MVAANRMSDELRADAWRAMTVLTAAYGHFSVATVAHLTPAAAYPRIAEWVGWLEREMVVRALGPSRYAVEVSGGCPPRDRMTNGRGSQQQRQIWTAMRKLRRWTEADLVEAAATEDCEMTPHAVRMFSRALIRAQLVTEPVLGFCRLRPAADTGPRAPVIHSDGTIFDLNTGQSINLNGSQVAA